LEPSLEKVKSQPCLVPRERSCFSAHEGWPFFHEMTECSKPLLLVKKRMRLRAGVEESAAVEEEAGLRRRGMAAAARARSGARREGRMVEGGEGFLGWGGGDSAVRIQD